MFESPPAHRPFSATERRLLNAAGEMFAGAGFHDVTVRDICKRAGANIAAVHYHFGDKQGLYDAVLNYAYECSLAKHPPDAGLRSAATAAERLHAFVTAFLSRLFDEGRPAWHARLMAREMAAPTPALDALVDRVVRTQFDLLQSIVRELLGPAAAPACVRDCAISVVGQVLHYWHCRSVIQRLVPGFIPGPARVPALAEHITRFSLAALRGLRHQAPRSDAHGAVRPPDPAAARGAPRAAPPLRPADRGMEAGPRPKDGGGQRAATGDRRRTSRSAAQARGGSR